MRTTIWPSRTTGRSTIRLAPMIATSGWLITGVVTMPPSGPRLVIVIVEPVSSSRVALPSRAAAARRATSAARCPEVERLGVAHHRHDQAVRGLRGDAEMHRRVAMHDAGLVVEARVDLRDSRGSTLAPARA